MEKIFNVKEYNYDCSTDHFYFINDAAVVCFYQMLNCDLVFSVYTFDSLDKVTFVINKNEFSEIYNLIDNMLNKIHSKKDIYGYRELFEKGYFSWKSDAPANEEAWSSNNSFVYNYLNIIPTLEEYRLEFINTTTNNRFGIEINTDRSRYGRIRFDMWDLYKQLESFCLVEEKSNLNESIKQLFLKKRNNNF